MVDAYSFPKGLEEVNEILEKIARIERNLAKGSNRQSPRRRWGRKWALRQERIRLERVRRRLAI